MREVQAHHSRGNGIRFNRVIDGSENDDFAGHVHDDAPARQVGNDFVFPVLRQSRNGYREENDEPQESRTD